jgi:hypothetical protein
MTKSFWEHLFGGEGEIRNKAGGKMGIGEQGDV